MKYFWKDYSFNLNSCLVDRVFLLDKITTFNIQSLENSCFFVASASLHLVHTWNLFIIIELTFRMVFTQHRQGEAEAGMNERKANSFCYNNMDRTWKQNYHKITINHEAIALYLHKECAEWKREREQLQWNALNHNFSKLEITSLSLTLTQKLLSVSFKWKSLDYIWANSLTKVFKFKVWMN